MARRNEPIHHIIPDAPMDTPAQERSKPRERTIDRGKLRLERGEKARTRRDILMTESPKNEIQAQCAVADYTVIQARKDFERLSPPYKGIEQIINALRNQQAILEDALEMSIEYESPERHLSFQEERSAVVKSLSEVKQLLAIISKIVEVHRQHDSGRRSFTKAEMETYFEHEDIQAFVNQFRRRLNISKTAIPVEKRMAALQQLQGYAEELEDAMNGIYALPRSERMNPDVEGKLKAIKRTLDDVRRLIHDILQTEKRDPYQPIGDSELQSEEEEMEVRPEDIQTVIRNDVFRKRRTRKRAEDAGNEMLFGTPITGTEADETLKWMDEKEAESGPLDPEAAERMNQQKIREAEERYNRTLLDKIQRSIDEELEKAPVPAKPYKPYSEPLFKDATESELETFVEDGYNRISTPPPPKPEVPHAPVLIPTQRIVDDLPLEEHTESDEAPETPRDPSVSPDKHVPTHSEQTSDITKLPGYTYIEGFHPKEWEHLAPEDRIARVRAERQSILEDRPHTKAVSGQISDTDWETWRRLQTDRANELAAAERFSSTGDERLLSIPADIEATRAKHEYVANYAKTIRHRLENGIRYEDREDVDQMLINLSRAYVELDERKHILDRTTASEDHAAENEVIFETMRLIENLRHDLHNIDFIEEPPTIETREATDLEREDIVRSVDDIENPIIDVRPSTTSEKREVSKALRGIQGPSIEAREATNEERDEIFESLSDNSTPSIEAREATTSEKREVSKALRGTQGPSIEAREASDEERHEVETAIGVTNEARLELMQAAKRRKMAKLTQYSNDLYEAIKTAGIDNPDGYMYAQRSAVSRFFSGLMGKKAPSIPEQVIQRIIDGVTLAQAEYIADYFPTEEDRETDAYNRERDRSPLNNLANHRDIFTLWRTLNEEIERVQEGLPSKQSTDSIQQRRIQRSIRNPESTERDLQTIEHRSAARDYRAARGENLPTSAEALEEEYLRGEERQPERMRSTPLQGEEREAIERAKKLRMRFGEKPADIISIIESDARAYELPFSAAEYLNAMSDLLEATKLNNNRVQKKQLKQLIPPFEAMHEQLLEYGITIDSGLRILERAKKIIG